MSKSGLGEIMASSMLAAGVIWPNCIRQVVDVWPLTMGIPSTAADFAALQEDLTVSAFGRIDRALDVDGKTGILAGPLGRHGVPQNLQMTWLFRCSPTVSGEACSA